MGSIYAQVPSNVLFISYKHSADEIIWLLHVWVES